MGLDTFLPFLDKKKLKKKYFYHDVALFYHVNNNVS